MQEVGRERKSWGTNIEGVGDSTTKDLVIHVEKLGFLPRAHNKPQAIYIGEYLRFILEIPLPGVYRLDSREEEQLG